MTVLSDAQIAAKAYAAGFRGNALVQAIAHVLAESGGNSAAVSATDDHGWFQWNRRYHPEGVAVAGTDAEFSLAYRVTNGGANWGQWSTTGNGAAARMVGRATIAAAGAASGVAGLARAAVAAVLPLPAGSYSVSQAFGRQNGYDAGGHAGVDLAAPKGTPIYSVFDGTVTRVGEDGFGPYAVVVRRADGLTATYGHGSAAFVKVGQTVKAGQQIGAVGSEGHSTGNHLHFQLNNAAGARVDPMAWLTSNGASGDGQGGTGTETVGLPGVPDLGDIAGKIVDGVTHVFQEFAVSLFVIMLKGTLVAAGAGLVVIGVASTAKHAGVPGANLPIPGL